MLTVRTAFDVAEWAPVGPHLSSRVSPGELRAASPWDRSRVSSRGRFYSSWRWRNQKNCAALFNPIESHHSTMPEKRRLLHPSPCAQLQPFTPSCSPLKFSMLQ